MISDLNAVKKFSPTVLVEKESKLAIFAWRKERLELLERLDFGEFWNDTSECIVIQHSARDRKVTEYPYKSKKKELQRIQWQIVQPLGISPLNLLLSNSLSEM